MEWQQIFLITHQLAKYSFIYHFFTLIYESFFLSHWSCSIFYRQTKNSRCGGAESFSSPPYSLLGFMNFLTESCFGLCRGIDAAPPWRFLNFYLKPSNLPPSDPQMTTLPKVKKIKKIFSFIFIYFVVE